MTGPPNGKVPAPGGPWRRDSSPHQRDLEDLTSQASPTVEHITGIDGWPALAAWLQAATR